MLLNSFYTVVNQEVEGTRFTTDVIFNTDHIIYQGHFPKHSITPGVCILQTAKQLIESHLEGSLKVRKIPNVKFLKVVFPDDQKILQYQIELTYTEDAILTAIIRLTDSNETLYTKAIVMYAHS